MNALLVEQSLHNYQLIADKMQEIDKALQTRSNISLAELHQQLNTLFENAKATDSLILDMVRKNPLIKEDERIVGLLSLMHAVHRANQKMSSQLHSILAVHRDQLRKMKQGTTLLQGYRPATIHTGKKISISN